jgi:hypothetical protein
VGVIGTTPEETSVLLVAATDKALRHVAERNRGVSLAEFRPLVANVVFIAVVQLVGSKTTTDDARLHAVVDSCVTLHAGGGTDNERLCIDFDAIARQLHGERDTDPSPVALG